MVSPKFSLESFGIILYGDTFQTPTVSPGYLPKGGAVHLSLLLLLPGGVRLGVWGSSPCPDLVPQAPPLHSVKMVPGPAPCADTEDA